ncbi:type II toxin-antitoxin system TacA family antitoxin [Porticoccus sp. GXU_MW_L64]
MAKTAPINMRAEPEQHALLTKAADVMNKDRSVFILEVACREAENVLLDQRLFQLDDNAFDAFEQALAETPPQNTKLKKLLADKSQWK